MEEPRHCRGISVHHGTMTDPDGVVGSKNGHGFGGQA